MTLPLSVVLIVFGAILTWGVNAHPNGVNVTAVGVILMVVGLVGFVLSLVLWERLGWGHPAAVYDDRDVIVRRRPYPERRPRRSTTVIEEDERSGRPPV
jgi:hypothetical protein